MSTAVQLAASRVSFRNVHDTLNGAWHRTASIVFLVIVLAHWVEHLLQAVQIFMLGWPRPAARGGLGLIFPWLVTSEWLHYAYAVVMLIGFLLLRGAYKGRARAWWDTALVIQVWHHFEHALLLGQAIAGVNLFGSGAPVSILQLVVPRVELHLFYNAVVFIPMVIAMAYHASPPTGTAPTCGCHRLGFWYRPQYQ
jgi:hypothetical protein